MPSFVTIIHGDTTVKSREALHQILTQSRSAKKDVVRVNAKNLSRAELETALTSRSLFGGERVVHIEGLLSLPQSQKKKGFLEMITTAAATEQQVVLWEPKLLTAATLKKFPQATVITCKTPKILFNWLDLLGNTKSKSKLHQELPALLSAESPVFVVSMLQRQVRLLIAAADGGVVAGPPFVVQKLRQQSRHFTLPQLLRAHTGLMEIEYRQKQGLSRLNWHEELDLWLLSL